MLRGSDGGLGSQAERVTRPSPTVEPDLGNASVGMSGLAQVASGRYGRLQRWDTCPAFFVARRASRPPDSATDRGSTAASGALIPSPRQGTTSFVTISVAPHPLHASAGVAQLGVRGISKRLGTVQALVNVLLDV